MVRRLKGQSVAEYAVVFAVVIAALIAMRFYIIRGIQGRYYETVHGMGDHYAAGNTVYKYTSQQLDRMETYETFGGTWNSALGFVPQQGVSGYYIMKPSEFKRSAVGADAENIAVPFDSENLY